jgi:ubiquitin-protein ligase E3 C
MFQTFSGNARRPRQVNLSGRTNNPFATVQQAGSSPQNAVLHAQNERKARQVERERLQAAKALQRTWRGYNSRRKWRDSLREEFDKMRKQGEWEVSAVAQLKLLIQFATPSRGQDALRLQDWVQDLLRTNVTSELQYTHSLKRLVAITLDFISSIMPTPSSSADFRSHENLLVGLLRFQLLMWRTSTFYMMKKVEGYYKALGTLLLKKVTGPSTDYYQLTEVRDQLQWNILEPLKLVGEVPGSINATYLQFSKHILSVPYLHLEYDMQKFADQRLFDPRQVMESLGQEVEPTKTLKGLPHVNLLWLLAQIIQLQGRRDTTKTNSLGNINQTAFNNLSTLTWFLSSVTNADIESLENPANQFLREKFSELRDRSRIASIIAFNSPQKQDDPEGKIRRHHIGRIANFALTLLRLFPAYRDDIRSLLYLQSGGMYNGQEMPIVKVFWELLRTSTLYKAISKQPPKTFNDFTKDEMNFGLIFLELYSVVLRVMDDEEFLNGDKPTDLPKSLVQLSALSLSDVRELSIFLKNFAFSLYMNPSEEELLDDGANKHSASQTDSFQGFAAISALYINHNASSTDGVQFMTVPYVKDMVTGVLRQIYDRE